MVGQEKPSSSLTSSDMSILAQCRRDPTWKTVDYAECQRLTGWNPRSKWWREDSLATTETLDGKESEIEQCLQDAFELAEKDSAWPR